MASGKDAGGSLPPLVLVLLASFLLMILSGLFFGLGLPEDWARGLFMVTVVLWFVLGGALMVQGFLENRRYAQAAVATPVAPKEEDANDGDEG